MKHWLETNFQFQGIPIAIGTEINSFGGSNKLVKYFLDEGNNTRRI